MKPSAGRHRAAHWLTSAAAALLALSTWSGASRATESGTVPAPDCGTGGAANSFAGRAYSIHLDSSVLGIAVDLGPVPDTGELPATGGDRAATLATVDGVDTGLPLPNALSLNAAILHNTVMGSGNMSTAYSSVVGLNLGLTSGLTKLLSVSADALTAQSTVKCVSRIRKVDAANTGSQIVNLAINVLGVPIVIPASAPANTRLALPSALKLLAKGSITLNEQTTVNGRQVVNALHVKLELLGVLSSKLASIDLVISHADANITCGSGTDPDSCNCPVKDFVTGGGQIPLNPGKGSFSVNGKAAGTNGPAGHLNFINHNTRQHVRSSALTDYSATGTRARTLTYTCSDNQYLSNATCTAYIEDNATSGGGGDVFGLDPGYPKRAMSNGNIVLHKPSCGVYTGGGSTGGGGQGGGKGGGKNR